MYYENSTIELIMAVSIPYFVLCFVLRMYYVFMKIKNVFKNLWNNFIFISRLDFSMIYVSAHLPYRQILTGITSIILI